MTIVESQHEWRLTVPACAMAIVNDVKDLAQAD
jgi:hypothetical protein